MMTDSDLKRVVASNLCRYRKENNLTQLELAERLNYSDKSISKWERGDGLPDLLIMVKIALIYGISVNDLLIERKRLARPKHKLNKLLITLISYTGVWAIATGVFALLGIFSPEANRSWLAFIYAIPASFIVLTFFAFIWGRKIHSFITFSLLSWSIPLAIFVSLQYQQLWLLFIAIIPLQLITIFAYFLKPRRLKSE
jgi:transcriptional regulator with XRE-family HTH domain